MSVNGFDFDGTVHRYNYNSLDNIPPNIAPAYSASSTYAVGDYCTKDNVLYKCSTAISTAEAWNSAHWSQVQLATDVADLKDDLSDILGSETEILIPLAYTQTGYYIALDGTTADLNNPIASVYGHAYIVADCQEGDQFIVNAQGGGRPRAWGFINAQNVIISVADSGVTVSNLRLTAPSRATKLIINDNSEPNKTSYRVTTQSGNNGIVVRYDVEQNHTEAEKARARANIGAIIDETLSIQGEAADAKAVGDAIEAIELGLSEAAKTALLNCFAHVAWLDENSDLYITALENALYASRYPKIVAVYDSSYVPIIGDNVNTLKSHLTVTYYAESGASGTTLSSNDYTLLGNLDESISRVTAVYGTYIDTFTVNVVDIYNKYTWNYPNDTLLHSVLGYSSTNGDIYSVNDHRSLYADHGKTNAQVQYTNGNLINSGNAFMIPIPSDATKATVTISSSWNVAFSIWDYSSGRSSRSWAGGTNGWQFGTATITFTARENLALCLSYKLSSNANLTSQDVSAISITFE